MCNHRICFSSGSEAAVDEVPSVDRTEKTRENNQMRVVYCAHPGAEIASIRQYMRKETTTEGIER